MKVKTLFAIVIKVAGIVALWKFLTSLGGLVMGVGLFSTLQTGLQGSGFMASIALSMLMTTGITGAAAFICLLSTDSLIRLLNIDGEQMINIGTDKTMAFKALALIGVLLLIVNGASDALSYDFKTDTNNGTNIVNGVVNTTNSVVNSHTKKVNYFAFIELVLGIMGLFRIGAVALWLRDRFGDEEQARPQEWPDMYKQPQ